MPVCFTCGSTTVFPSIEAIKLHYYFFHQFHEKSAYLCSEDGCVFKKSFSSWSKLRAHFKLFHKFSKYNTVGGPSSNCTVLNDVNDINNTRTDQGEADFSTAGTDENDTASTEPIDFRKILTEHAFKFVAMLYSRPSFPRSLVQVVVDGVTSLLENTTAQIEGRLEACLEASSLDQTDKDQIISFTNSLKDPFHSLSSDYLRLKYFEKSGYLIPSIECKVGERYEFQFTNNKIVKQVVDCNATLIPLRTILKKFFELPGNLSIVLNYMNNIKGEEHVLYNFIQGRLWKRKSRPYEAENKIVLPLFLGIDDLEINNPLGAHNGVSEIGPVYASIPCIPPEFNSSLENIFLTYMYYLSDRKALQGNYTVFKYVVNELNFLARTGIEVICGQERKQIYFILGLILGDNKGLNEVLGFAGGFSANYYCRFCKRHNDECSSDFEEVPGSIRKSSDYLHDVRAGLQGSGINERSVWLNVDHFHPVENFAVCSLHDFDEGISRYAMPLICSYFISTARVFDLEFLNERMLGFNYQLNGFSNKPTAITEDNLKNLHFRMSGSEMRTFVLCFNFLVGDYVPLNNEVWKYYCIVRKLTEFIACKAFPKDHIDTLKDLIREHNILYCKLFGRLKPKMHILVHYCSVILESGPIPFLSMIRDEGKHKEIKESASATNSRKNVTFTLSLKQQLKFCYRLASGQGLKSEIEHGRPYLIQSVTSIDNFDSFSDSLPESFRDISCIGVKWCTFKGTKYRKDMCVVIDICGEGILPCFGVIQTMLINSSGEVCFVCQMLKTHGFDDLMRAYETQYSEEMKCVLVGNLWSSVPAIKQTFNNGKQFVGLRCLL